MTDVTQVNVNELEDIVASRGSAAARERWEAREIWRGVETEDELRNLRPLDAIRVAAQVPRAFEAGPGGLELLAFGPRVVGDAEVVADPWTDQPPRER